jgi:polyhydroxybutyrate depolymerase
VIRRLLAATAVCLLAATGCSSPSDPEPQPAPSASSAPVEGGTHKETVELGDRPFTLYVPDSYQSGTKLPLVVLLHGYAASGDRQESYFKLAPLAGPKGFLYATPDGLADSQGNRFWNATAACCDLYGNGVDDVAYLADLIRTVADEYTVDTDKVYLIGHSNGAFMSYRMACEHADLITGIVALNGAMLNDVSTCRPSRPVSVLTIRGTNDLTIVNPGGQIAGDPYPSTATTVQDWVGLDGCQAIGDSTSVAPLDLESTLAGPETTVTRYPGCRDGTVVELWTVQGGGHIPTLTDAYAPAVINFLLFLSR